MLARLKSIRQFQLIKKDTLSSKIQKIQDDLSDGLFGVMNSAFDERKLDSINSLLGMSSTDDIVDGYANKNMIIAAASSIVPGPLGILGSIPELLLNFGNQMKMVYDLGCATGKENFINKDVLLDIPLAAFGGNTNLMALQNNANDLMDAPADVLLQKAKDLSQNMVTKTLQKSVVNFIPIAGPVLMATWSKMATRKISKVSLNFLDNSKEYKEQVTPEATEEIKVQLQIERIKGLVNLIEANNDINTDQIELIGTIIENANISDDQKAYYLEEALKTGSMLEIDGSLLNQYEEADDLIMEMSVMAKRSGSVDVYEKEYIYKVGQQLGVEEELIDDLL